MSLFYESALFIAHRLRDNSDEDGSDDDDEDDEDDEDEDGDGDDDDDDDDDDDEDEDRSDGEADGDARQRDRNTPRTSHSISQRLISSYLESRSIYIHTTSNPPSSRAPSNISTRLHWVGTRSHRRYPNPWSSTLHGDIHVFFLFTYRIPRWAYKGV